MYCRVLKSGRCEITQGYFKGRHNGTDLVGKGYTLDYIVAHSDGVVVEARNNFEGFKSGSYGNYVKIKHNNYYTLYAHMAVGSVMVRPGDRVHKGEVIGYMGNTGESFGAHLHFEVRTLYNNRINSEVYINKDLEQETDLKSISEIVREVKEGLWGNQPERQNRLEAAGYNYEEVRRAVNASYNKKFTEYVVKKGDCLSIIANKYGVSYQKIAKDNGIDNPNLIYPGQRLKIWQ